MAPGLRVRTYSREAGLPGRERGDRPLVRPGGFQWSLEVELELGGGVGAWRWSRSMEVESEHGGGAGARRWSRSLEELGAAYGSKRRWRRPAAEASCGGGGGERRGGKVQRRTTGWLTSTSGCACHYQPWPCVCSGDLFSGAWSAALPGGFCVGLSQLPGGFSRVLAALASALAAKRGRVPLT
jgi:hypothetical protein